MLSKLLFVGIMTFLILDIGKPLGTQAAHKNSLITKFCIASLKSKIDFNDKQDSNEISHFACECFFKKYNSGTSLKRSRIYCKNKASEKYNL